MVRLYLNNFGYVIVDNEDVEMLSNYNWTLGNHGYARCDKILMHRLLMNCPKGMVVDHINGDKLDNRRCNLRICTQSENLQHRNNAPNTSTSGVLGVSYDRQRDKWRSYIRVNGKTITLGRYDTIELALNRRIEAEQEYYGEFSPNR